MHDVGGPIDGIEERLSVHQVSRHELKLLEVFTQRLLELLQSVQREALLRFHQLHIATERRIVQR